MLHLLGLAAKLLARTRLGQRLPVQLLCPRIKLLPPVLQFLQSGLAFGLMAAALLVALSIALGLLANRILLGLFGGALGAGQGRPLLRQGQSLGPDLLVLCARTRGTTLRFAGRLLGSHAERGGWHTGRRGTIAHLVTCRLLGDRRRRWARTLFGRGWRGGRRGLLRRSARRLR